MLWPWQRWRNSRQQALEARLKSAVVQLTKAELVIAKGPLVACIWPDVIALSPSQRYAWCRCGLSANGVWCDGSHGSGEGPLLFSPKRAQHYWLCTCKQTRTPPYCDASHHRLVPPS
ncbi:CDGSH iron-sulfur domain-containing protein [Paraperlucidibaca wandonensis]|uniref:CDGSH iron-sulfur domain-containing protein n=1 Tax=Paraperlucidibaca wandonensis TaxID=1268273 RepID=A0ABW3HC22_9GAMM